MRISVHSDVLTEMGLWLLDVPKSDDWLQRLFEKRDTELLTTSLSVIRAYETISKTRGPEVARKCVSVLLDNLLVVPLRASSLREWVEGETADIELSLHSAVNSLVNIDCVVTRLQPEASVNGMLLRSPEEVFSLEDTVGEEPEIVPFLDLKAQYPRILNEIDDRVTKILEQSAFILGDQVEEFEHSFANAQEAKYCIAVSSGTDALHVAMLALDIGPGDGVVVPANTFFATAEAVSLCGATPVFIDCDDTHNMNPQALRALLEESSGRIQLPSGDDLRIKALIPVHLYGQPGAIDELCGIADEFDLKVVEDCAQSHLAEYKGKKTGNFGTFGAFSFYPGKNLGAFGEAGALVTNDEKQFRRAKSLRQHGEDERYIHKVVGHNYRMEGIQGAVLATKLKHLPEWTRLRRRNASTYQNLLCDVESIEFPRQLPDAVGVYHLFVIRAQDRDKLQAHLTANGIATGLHYPLPLHLQEAYRGLGYKRGDFPQSEKFAESILSLPMYPELRQNQIGYVCKKIVQFYS